MADILRHDEDEDHVHKLRWRRLVWGVGLLALYFFMPLLLGFAPGESPGPLFLGLESEVQLLICLGGIITLTRAWPAASPGRWLRNSCILAGISRLLTSGALAYLGWKSYSAAKISAFEMLATYMEDLKWRQWTLLFGGLDNLLKLALLTAFLYLLWRVRLALKRPIWYYVGLVVFIPVAAFRLLRFAMDAAEWSGAPAAMMRYPRMLQGIFFNHAWLMIGIPWYACGVYLLGLWIFLYRRYRTISGRKANAPADVKAES